jgi:hypothetical protein
MAKRERNLQEIKDGAKEGAARAEKLHAKADDLHDRTEAVHRTGPREDHRHAGTRHFHA